MYAHADCMHSELELTEQMSPERFKNGESQLELEFERLFKQDDSNKKIFFSSSNYE